MMSEVQRIVLAAVCAAGLYYSTTPTTAQTTPRGPRAELLPTNVPLELTGEVDSNSPALWMRVGGRQTLFVMTSFAGKPSTAFGRDAWSLGRAEPVVLDPWPGGGVWMEAIVADDAGTWYGYYHNELAAEVCASPTKVIPRIGAARSRDRGRTWESLGVILEAPPLTHDCTTTNTYFVGGVGDLSVQLDPESQDLYFFYSTYLRTERLQGVAVGRLAWADRDEPAGKLMVWQQSRWMAASSFNPGKGMQRRWIYPAAIPIFPAGDSWHDEDRIVDAFWGPSVHWNTHLERYVMLLNRARDDNFQQEGIYVSFAPSLDDPRLWSAPVKLLNEGKWYPQVMGLDVGSGTDKVAGEWGRFFMSGVSQHLIHFIK